MSYHKETNPHFNPQSQDHHVRPHSRDNGVPPLPTPAHLPLGPQQPTHPPWVVQPSYQPSSTVPHQPQGSSTSTHHPQGLSPTHSQQPLPTQGRQPPPSRQGLPSRHGQGYKAFIWSAAVFCAIFSIIVIVGGLIVLIIYLVYRPQSPRFNISSVTLNAAYLDMGYLLNADVTVLANFTNPNKKVKVDFSYIIIDLYYGDTPIATTAIEPFSATSRVSMFANLHMVSSQVRLSVKDSQRLATQMQSNRVAFKINGLFRTRSNFGGFLKYSYWLYSHCSFVVTAPPSGVLVASKCRTKR